MQIATWCASFARAALWKRANVRSYLTPVRDDSFKRHRHKSIYRLTPRSFQSSTYLAYEWYFWISRFAFAMSSLSTLPASDASDSGTIGPEPAIFTAIWLPVQIFFVGLRYYSRSISRRSWALDDILVLISLAFQIAIAGLTFGNIQPLNHFQKVNSRQLNSPIDSYVNGGLGHHFLYLLTVHPTTATHYLLNNFTISLLCIPASSIPRLAILHLYHRLFTSPRLRLQILILSLILLLAAAIYLTLICLMCIPIRANWDITMKESEYKCIDVVALQIWTSFPSLLIDGWMLALPLPTIWRLRGAGRRLKWGVGGALGVGSLCVFPFFPPPTLSIMPFPPYLSFYLIFQPLPTHEIRTDKKKQRPHNSHNPLRHLPNNQFPRSLPRRRQPPNLGPSRERLLPHFRLLTRMSPCSWS